MRAGEARKRGRGKKEKMSKGDVLIIIGVIGMIASLIWEILAGGDEAVTVIAPVYTTAMVITGFLWVMNDTIRDNNAILGDNSKTLAEINRVLTEVNGTLKEMRDEIRALRMRRGDEHRNTSS
ncbi:MAG: hypothetical protein OD814_001342 [Candidatus Alkanophagales archaeon MCA70_species_1]|nr:hypothetical protein [Candidatus Alkanophaga volatiphilum]